MFKKNAIALLITMFFIMAITITIGVSLGHINSAKENLSSEKFLLQTTAVLDDMMKILKETPELDDINDTQTFRAFLLQYSTVVPLSTDIMVEVKLESARSKFNFNALKKNTAQGENALKNALIGYFNAKMINSEYLYLLEDLTGGIKEDGMYNSALFDDNPYLFRDYISSDEQIKELNEYYKKIYHDNSVEYINLHNIFNFGNYKNSAYVIDLNFVNRDVFNIMSGNYYEQENTDAEDDNFFVDCEKLTAEEKENLKRKFNASCDLQKIITVTLLVTQGKQNAEIKFEYNIKTKKGSNFVYKI
ncbi:hypothetical protein FJR45_06865 [Sulfurimonas sediminis]|uniref:Type II secretion system protein K n=1 Tax=Sulfurimonas sediminis TaxID=2590020 RepID=A0A7M1B1N8_9BACT|nr:hypothetical protein [Sulfurimonas sediminis]QOP43687.1 hypothetical protein FJR45_06865 [Sulfurimonas sediminis]